MSCPYYKERLGGGAIGYCKDISRKVPSKKHQDCLCQSDAKSYVNFCPIYAKLEQGENKIDAFKRIFVGRQTNRRQSIPDDLKNRISAIRD